MRVLKDHQDGVLVQSYPPAAQHSSSLAHAQQLWNEWEIQCLVIASFALQVFLLFAAGFRKRCYSRVLRGLLWLAYLMADSVAIYVLGRFTFLVGDDPRRQLALFWAPFLLLHLGGQDTITAFSMEDNALWKRHLLNLTSQVALAIYVVCKQWRGDKLLVAPMVLMFISGTIKYTERIWALRTVSARTTASISVGASSGEDARTHYMRTVDIVLGMQEKNVEYIMKVAANSFSLNLDFLMDVIPIKNMHYGYEDEFYAALKEISYSQNGVLIGISSSGASMAYKLAEIQLSLIYDYLYTKFGTVRFHVKGALLHWLGTLSLTSSALVLFVRAMEAGRRSVTYNGPDVTLSYVLLIGAIILEISSIFIASVSSYWAGPSIARYLHPQSSQGGCSGMLGQYNMLGRCAQERQAARAGLFQQMVHRWIKEGDTTHVAVSSHVKKMLLDKLFEIVTTQLLISSDSWNYHTFDFQWALLAARGIDPSHRGTSSAAQPTASSLPSENAAERALRYGNIKADNFVKNAIVWHFVTDMCLLADGSDSEITSSVKMLSEYIMYLIKKHNMMVDSDGHVTIKQCLQEVLSSGFLDEFSQPDFIQRLRGGDVEARNSQFLPVQVRARYVSVNLLKLQHDARWKLIAAVWTEMLCYMALNVGAGFHAKHLSTGGEFITHVKMLLFIVGLPFC